MDLGGRAASEENLTTPICMGAGEGLEEEGIFDTDFHRAVEPQIKRFNHEETMKPEPPVGYNTGS
ncbi:MAG: hypothetical protein GY869_05690 [Planctomycetes bacterium]|nr:hypothetical protein [Planctomycetota bacterium]